MTLDNLTPRYVGLQEEARTAAAALAEVAVEADNSSSLHPGVLATLQASGLLGLLVPAAYGGRDERIDPLAVCVVREVLMGTSSAADSLFALQGIGSYALTCAGTSEQKTRWLPGVASGDILAALALTEPEAGSDLKGVRTTAVSQGDTVLLNGDKSFISNAGVAGFYTLLAREEAGLSAFLVPAGTSGLDVRATPELAAAHVLGDLHLDGVVLPRSARIGAPGAGLQHVLSTLSVFRVSVAGAAVGLAQVALDEALRHAKIREQFGRPLIRLGPVAALLADSWAEVASTRLLTYRAAELAREDPLGNLEHSSLAKLAATEACSRVVDRCVQVMGRWGLVRDSRIERCQRQSRPMRIYEGASEVLRLGIARHMAAEAER